MKLWLLKPIHDWDPWYDKVFGFVIRAETETDARSIACVLSGEEGKDVWKDNSLTLCHELTSDGKVGVVLIDTALA